MTNPMSLLPDHDKFSSLSNKTVVAIFPNVCLWRRSYAQNWEVLTLKNCYSIEPPSYASTAYVAASYGPRFFSTVRFVRSWLTCENFWGQMVYRPPPPNPLAQNFPYAYELQHTFLHISLPLFCMTTTWNVQKLPGFHVFTYSGHLEFVRRFVELSFHFGSRFYT